jgi:elongation factor P
MYVDDQPLLLEMPDIVSLKVVLTATPSHAGSPGGNVYKDARLENGLEIKAPLFIKTGDIVRVDTRTRTYVGKDAT